MLARRDGGVTPLVSPAVLDLNAHVLPGIHAATPRLDDSLAAARALLDAGVTRAVAPAVITASPRDDLVAADAARRALAGALAEAGLPLALLPGAVARVDALQAMDAADLAMCTAGGGGRWLVCTLPDAGWPLGIGPVVEGLQRSGLGLVLAHPERAAAVQAAPHRLRDVIGRGALVQLAAGSLAGADGPRAERTALDLLRNGMVTVVASDAPSPAGHVLSLDRAADAVERVLRRPAEEVMWMFAEGPTAIAQGEPVRPPRLVPQPRVPG